MVDPLTITAATFGITTSTLHFLGKFIDDLKRIKDAPVVVANLKKDMESFHAVLASLDDNPDGELELIGNSLTDQAKNTIKTCTDECGTLRGDLLRWTSRSKDGKLHWLDRAKVGVFNQDRIKSMSQQLQNCKITIDLVVSSATLYSSIRHTHITEEIHKMASMRQTEITAGIRSTDEQLDELGTRMGQLNIVSDTQEDPEATEDREDAMRQAKEAQKALHASRELMNELLKKVQNDCGPKAARSSVTIGDHNSNSGFQSAINNGSINGVSFGVKFP